MFQTLYNYVFWRDFVLFFVNRILGSLPFDEAEALRIKWPELSNMGVRYMAKRMSLPSKKRKEGEEKQEKQEEPKQNEDPKSFIGFWSWTCLLPPDRFDTLSRWVGKYRHFRL